jgi:hypothetical protein
MLKRVSGQSAQLHPHCRVAVPLSATMPMRMGEPEVWTGAILSSPEKRPGKTRPSRKCPLREIATIGFHRWTSAALKRQAHPLAGTGRYENTEAVIQEMRGRKGSFITCHSKSRAGKIYNPDDRRVQIRPRTASRSGAYRSNLFPHRQGSKFNAWSRYEAETATRTAARIGGKA